MITPITLCRTAGAPRYGMAVGLYLAALSGDGAGYEAGLPACTS
jgi:protein tyrosine/serine phosphatase